MVLDMNEHLILNQLLLIFKMYIYNVKTTGYLNISHLLTHVTYAYSQCKNTGYLNISHLLTYVKGVKDTAKKLCD